MRSSSTIRSSWYSISSMGDTRLHEHGTVADVGVLHGRICFVGLIDKPDCCANMTWASCACKAARSMASWPMWLLEKEATRSSTERDMMMG